MWRRLLAFGLVIAAMTFAAEGRAERRVALVVGNSAYDTTAALRNPRNDANDMAEALKALGFEVVAGFDLDQEGFARAIDNFARALEGADVALFFYAGHGLQINEKNYLVSVNARLSNEFLISSETIELDAVVRLMESKVPINIVFLDACRNNPLAENLKRSLAVMRRSVSLGRGLARLEPTSRDTLIAFAAAPGQEAADGNDRNSPFTAALLKSMPQRGVEISVMLKEVAAEVRQLTRNAQRPQQLSDMSRQFYFAPAAMVVAKATPPATALPLPGVTAPSPPRNAQASEDRSLEIAFWSSARAANECDAMRAYLQRYPKGVFVDLAKLSEARLCAPDRNVTMVETVPSAPSAASVAPAAAPKPAAEIAPKAASTASTAGAPPAPVLPARPPQQASAPASSPAVPAPAPTRPVPSATPAPQIALVKPPSLPPPHSTAPANAFRDCEHCPELISLPGGTFAMGSNDDPSERPVHQVTVAAFAIGRYPVTIGEWRHCVADKACSYEPNGDDDLPVYNVSWVDAQQYVAWLSKITSSSYRLPSEAEWEYAARAGSSSKYWWGSQIVACKGCGTDANTSQPLKAGQFAPNSFGLYDMTGSVAQWVADCWLKNHAGAPRDGAAREMPNCRQYVLRGGSWKNDASYLRSSSRDNYDAGVRYLTHGFRVARARSK